jgi:hypothetical protein
MPVETLDWMIETSEPPEGEGEELPGHPRSPRRARNSLGDTPNSALNTLLR